MNLNFADALRALGTGAVFRVANEARPPGDYLFATLLPEENHWTYDIKSGYMAVRTTMAGLVGMDSPYPPTGLTEMSTFIEQVAKIANEVKLSEQVLRQLQAMLTQLRINEQPTNDAIQREALNFLNKVVIQAHMDTMEYLRGQCLVKGLIDFTYNQIRLQVTYGVPAANIFANRTGTAAYYNTASLYWTDVRNARKILRNNLRAIIAHSDTINDIVYNDANKARVVNQGEGFITIQRYAGTTEQPTGDQRDTVTMIAYDAEAEILNIGVPGTTTKIPFMSRGKLLFVGNNTRSGYRVGEGGTPNPINDQALGYTHLGPTVEGGGLPGRWAQLFTPEQEPWSLRGRGVTNGLPVLETPEKVVITSTDMAP